MSKTEQKIVKKKPVPCTPDPAKLERVKFALTLAAANEETEIVKLRRENAELEAKLKRWTDSSKGIEPETVELVRGSLAGILQQSDEQVAQLTKDLNRWRGTFPGLTPEQADEVWKKMAARVTSAREGQVQAEKRVRELEAELETWTKSEKWQSACAAIDEAKAAVETCADSIIKLAAWEKAFPGNTPGQIKAANTRLTQSTEHYKQELSKLSRMLENSVRDGNVLRNKAAELESVLRDWQTAASYDPTLSESAAQKFLVKPEQLKERIRTLYNAGAEAVRDWQNAALLDPLTLGPYLTAELATPDYMRDKFKLYADRLVAAERELLEWKQASMTGLNKAAFTMDEVRQRTPAHLQTYLKNTHDRVTHLQKGVDTTEVANMQKELAEWRSTALIGCTSPWPTFPPVPTPDMVKTRLQYLWDKLQEAQAYSAEWQKKLMRVRNSEELDPDRVLATAALYLENRCEEFETDQADYWFYSSAAKGLRGVLLRHNFADAEPYEVSDSPLRYTKTINSEQE